MSTFCYNLSMKKVPPSVLAYRKTCSFYELVPFLLFAVLLIAFSVGFAIYFFSQQLFDSAFYMTLIFNIMLFGLGAFLFVDTLLFLKKRNQNNYQKNDPIYVDAQNRTFIIYALSGSYLLPFDSVLKTRGDVFFSHSLLIIKYRNKNKKTSYIEVGMVEHIRQIKRQIKALTH